MTTSPPNNKSLQPSSPVSEHRFKIHCLGGFSAHIPPAPKQSRARVSYTLLWKICLSALRTVETHNSYLGNKQEVSFANSFFLSSFKQ